MLWLAPTLTALLAWGIAQGLVKKYIGEVSAERFCLYYAIANAAVNLAFWAWHDAPPAFAPEGRQFALYGLLAYALDGVAWIFYYRSITYGPISIVGTLSAAYPALTVTFAHHFLGESLTSAQGAGVGAVLLGCMALAWSPPQAQATRPTSARWMLYAGAALLLWGVSGTVTRYAYRLPNAHEANMALFIAISGLSTLGVYGLVMGAARGASGKELLRAFGPMATRRGQPAGRDRGVGPVARHTARRSLSRRHARVCVGRAEGASDCIAVGRDCCRVARDGPHHRRARIGRSFPTSHPAPRLIRGAVRTLKATTHRPSSARRCRA
jgi:drug/metabolite transporter (DMT)-like permease